MLSLNSILFCSFSSVRFDRSVGRLVCWLVCSQYIHREKMTKNGKAAKSNEKDGTDFTTSNAVLAGYMGLFICSLGWLVFRFGIFSIHNLPGWFFILWFGFHYNVYCVCVCVHVVFIFQSSVGRQSSSCSHRTTVSHLCV